uniref:Uncharacterized protein n=1 Tax=Pyramimonas obovata TaxID=1411642 RepID=A0A7S0RV34_9CHLO|mmetsp:Transcript_7173/g.14553  ORF Transcript_7173/g.14553 Transcript_7173/m.14553 type:complete len:383 (+) Transcript_7173:76-1224(+)|eukprot:CAMPEP_0118934546 /NCGR_PEP_ID=MMETSP1169-20130426/13884_1 /TAXON_ID=36882 /ORGANISM="Pyramimonas obovata, Strain CCMP722" /LENGTH=382 /DNA_ID=CAMNT_0006877463 /DNA_START=70 /DNA_END=1218 /DNA_ORIENTATION=+
MSVVMSAVGLTAVRGVRQDRTAQVQSHACARVISVGAETSSRVNTLSARMRTSRFGHADVMTIRSTRGRVPKVKVSSVEGEAEVATEEAPKTYKSDSAVWELDFCSRPIFDERKKKVWELLICDPERTFEYSEYFPNNKINSVQLRQALERVLAIDGVNPPQKIRFFRAQMQTIITKATAEFPFKTIPSRRCVTLMNWLEERHETVYPSHPGYDANAPPLMTYELGFPQELPDALRGEQWAFVAIPLSDVMTEAKATASGGFGDYFDTSKMSGDLAPDSLIPGVAVFSKRALALAAWTNGLELAGIKSDNDSGSLVLQTGVNNQWSYAKYRRTRSSIKEAEEWEAAKKEAGGVHFLAIQTDPEAPKCAGFWMLRDYKPSTKI